MKLVIHAFMGHKLTTTIIIIIIIYTLYAWMILNLLTFHVIACYVRSDM